jgi:hypothetical protein
MFDSWKKCIALLLMLVYASQSVAALVMPCHMDEQSAEVMADMPMHAMGHDMHHGMASDHTMGHSMAHADMAMGDDTQAPKIGDKPTCCGAMGHCLMGGCTIHGASNTLAYSIGDERISVADLYRLPQPFLLTSSHFRPPIFR